MNKLVSIDEIAPIMKEQMEHGGKVVFTPKGNSMRPLFRSNKDMVTKEIQYYFLSEAKWAIRVAQTGWQTWTVLCYAW